MSYLALSDSFEWVYICYGLRLLYYIYYYIIFTITVRGSALDVRI